jgi:hypothetical protein
MALSMVNVTPCLLISTCSCAMHILVSYDVVHKYNFKYKVDTLILNIPKFLDLHKILTPNINLSIINVVQTLFFFFWVITSIAIGLKTCYNV